MAKTYNLAEKTSPKVKRKRVHCKAKSSSLKTSKLYKKKNVGQG